MSNERPYAYKNVTAAETVTLRSPATHGTAGVLGYVNVTTVGTGTLIIYDNTAGSGTIIAQIIMTSLGSYVFEAQALIGLTYVRSNADGQVSIAYR